MLFNPMTELNSYVILAPVLAALAIHFSRAPGSAGIGLDFFVVMLLSMAILPEAVRKWDPTFAL